MLDKAVSICDAQFGTLYLREADRLRLLSTHNVPPAFAEAQRKGPFRPAPHGMLDAVMKTGRAVHLTDLAEAQSYLERDPRMVEAVEVGGIRSVVGVPLLKEGELIGLIGIYRRKFVLSLTSRSSWSRTSQPKPSSPSRMRGCSTNCSSGPQTSPSAPPTSPKR